MAESFICMHILYEIGTRIIPITFEMTQTKYATKIQTFFCTLISLQIIIYQSLYKVIIKHCIFIKI